MNRLKCPSCGKSLSFLNVAKAPTPFHLRCDHCGAKLRFGKHAVAIFIAALLFGLLSGFVAFTLGLGTAGFLAVLIAAVVIAEMTFFVIASSMALPLVLRDRNH